MQVTAAVFIASVVLPLVASLLMLLPYEGLRERAAWFGIGALALSTLGSAVTLAWVVQDGPLLLAWSFGMSSLSSWADLILLVDRLSALMMLLISAVSFVIHVYSRAYMQSEEGYVRFFALLGLLTFVLLCLVTSGNLLWLFVCWHGITWLLSAVLGFNRFRPQARAAVKKTFVVQMVGDVAFLTAVGLLFLRTGTVAISELGTSIETPQTVMEKKR